MTDFIEDLWLYILLSLLAVSASIDVADWAIKLASVAAKEKTPIELRIYTDLLNGCQYLSTEGGLVPRLTPAGRQVCKGVELL